jgi:hypothetical protein
MSQIVALSTNSRENAPCALAVHAQALVLPAVRRGSLGLGYYDSGELLARVSPREEDRPLDVAHTLRDVRADVLVLHTAGAPIEESARRENAQPFRFQNWLMARTGEISGFAEFRANVLESMPPYIRRGVHGDSGDEHFFHLFLSFLFDAGKINRSNVGTGEIRTALCQAVATVDAFAEAAGQRPAPFCAVVSDGYSIVAAGRETPIDYALIEGIRDCRDCRSSLASTAEGLGVDHEELRAVLLICGAVGDPAAPFTRLGSGAVLSVTPGTKVEFHTLEQIAGR